MQTIGTKKHPPGRQGRQGGFTLIELLVALGVTAVGLAGLMSLHVAMLKGNRVASANTEAVTLAQQTIEELRSMKVTDIETDYAAMPFEDVIMDTVDGRTGLTFTRKLSMNRITGTLVKMRVEMEWLDDGRDPGSLTPAQKELYGRRITLELIRTDLEMP